jgi:hypothetical protein
MMMLEEMAPIKTMAADEGMRPFKMAAAEAEAEAEVEAEVEAESTRWSWMKQNLHQKRVE